jgi:hypothetical protein
MPLDIRPYVKREEVRFDFSQVILKDLLGICIKRRPLVPLLYNNVFKSWG